MAKFSDYPRGLIILLASFASILLFIPSESFVSIGISQRMYIILVSLVEGVCAVGIVFLVLKYKDEEDDESSWRYNT